MSYQDRLESLPREEVDEILDFFYSHFGINFNYSEDDNGHIHLLFGKFDDYEEFVKNYFGTFLLKMFAFQINIELSEERNKTLQGLSDFIDRYVPEQSMIYKQISMNSKFKNIIGYNNRKT